MVCVVAVVCACVAVQQQASETRARAAKGGISENACLSNSTQVNKIEGWLMFFIVMRVMIVAWCSLMAVGSLGGVCMLVNGREDSMLLWKFGF